MRIIDSHQHFWKYHPQNHAWINEDMKIIQKDFLPEELSSIFDKEHIDGCVSVQVDQTEAETQFQIELAKNNPFIKGVVGWINLMNPSIEATLEKYQDQPIVKGFRHILQGEETGFMLQPKFIDGLKALAKKNYTYDLLIYHHQIPEALELLKDLDDLKIVIDHIAKPDIKNGNITDWAKNIKTLAKYPNVHCKISGMTTEADWRKWTSEELTPYLEIVVEAFGTNRLMFGSDWPVCLVASTYHQWLTTVKDYFSTFTNEEQAKIFASNCESFYTLDKV
jgi:L-fuconolactonase